MSTIRLTAVFGLFLLLLAGPAAAKGEPGYVDLEWIQIPADAREIQDIDLGPILDSLAADARDDGDDALVQALAMIKGVRLKSFSVDEGGDDSAAAAVEKVQKILAKDDWKRLVYMKDGDETIGVHTYYQGKDLVGLMIVVYEPGDSVAFVNVMGDLDLGKLMSLAGRIDQDHLEEIMAEYGAGDGIHIEIDDD